MKKFVAQPFSIENTKLLVEKFNTFSDKFIDYETNNYDWIPNAIEVSPAIWISQTIHPSKKIDEIFCENFKDDAENDTFDEFGISVQHFINNIVEIHIDFGLNINDPEPDDEWSGPRWIRKASLITLEDFLHNSLIENINHVLSESSDPGDYDIEVLKADFLMALGYDSIYNLSKLDI